MLLQVKAVIMTCLFIIQHIALPNNTLTQSDYTLLVLAAQVYKLKCQTKTRPLLNVDWVNYVAIYMLIYQRYQVFKPDFMYSKYMN